MDDQTTGQNMNMYILAGITLFLCFVLHFMYKIIFGSKKKEEPEHETLTQTDSVAATDKNERNAPEHRPTGKNKKRTAWKGKTDFSHPWLLKNLKGHPGTVLHMDFSANGKFMAATCDDNDEAVQAGIASVRRRRPRLKLRAAPAPAPPPPTTPSRLPPQLLLPELPRHLLTSERMWALGYPVEIEPNSTKAVMYINPPPVTRAHAFTAWDVNAPVFVPGGSQSDSGRGSLGSSPRSDSDEETDNLEYLCVRCDKVFRMSRDGEYLSEDMCSYHWGRVSVNGTYSCCNTILGSRGCSAARYHVWNGTRPGPNGPIDGYVRARSPRGGVYAIDTEMCYTAAGLELASVAVVGIDGRLVYRSLVKPNSPILDYNTRFSGIRPRDMARATKTLRDVQNDILGFVGTDTILVGHALDNDLRALKLLHSAVIDTCALYPHARGFPLRRSLRALSEEYLGRNIQRGTAGHSPCEDARAAMDLALLKVQMDRASRIRHFINTIPICQPYDPLVNVPCC